MIGDGIIHRCPTNTLRDLLLCADTNMRYTVIAVHICTLTYNNIMSHSFCLLAYQAHHTQLFDLYMTHINTCIYTSECTVYKSFHVSMIILFAKKRQQLCVMR